MKSNRLIVFILFVFLIADLVYLAQSIYSCTIKSLSRYFRYCHDADDNQRFFLACYCAFWAYVAYGGDRCTNQESIQRLTDQPIMRYKEKLDHFCITHF